MNLSLATDILKRKRGREVLEPPGCCLTFAPHPAPWMRRRASVPVGIVMEHRYAFWLWMRAKKELQYDLRSRSWIDERDFRPPDLLTLDWHDDVGGPCDYIESELLRLNQRDENEVGFFCWAGLRSINDGHIAPAMWLNAIGNVYAVVKHRDASEPRKWTLTDRHGREHSVTYVRSPAAFVKSWRQSEQGDGLLWDIDLDYFTESKAVADQQYSPLLPDKTIAKAMDISQEWVQEVLANLRGFTIALEPEYTGGLSNSLHLFRQWEKALFDVPLFDKHCAWKAVLE